MTQPISPFMAELMAQSMAETGRMTSIVIDTLTNDLADKTAELEAVRAGIEELLSRPWMPTPDYIRQALYPEVGAWMRFLPNRD